MMPAGERVAQITVPPERAYVGVARNFVGDVGAEEGWISDERLEDLRLAVSEAVTNAIRAEARSGADAQILVRCSVDASRFEVRIRDRGGGFGVPVVPPPVPEPDPEREGGFGLSLMAALVDDARFVDVDGGTEVCLTLFRPDDG